MAKLTVARLDDTNAEHVVLTQWVDLPQFGTFGLASVRWKTGSDSILSAVLAPDGSLREYRVSANTYIDKAFGKGFSGLEGLISILRELWAKGPPPSPAPRAP